MWAESSNSDRYREPLRLVHPDCNSLAIPNRFKQKKYLLDFEGCSLGFRQYAAILDILPYFYAKSPVFCGLGGTRTCDLTDVNGAF